MARFIRDKFVGGMQVHTTNVTLAVTNAVTDATIAVAGLAAPTVGARIIKWWLKKVTAGTGTGDITAYLVVNGGTSSTRQICSPIVVDTDLAGPTVQDGGAFASGMYEIAATDVNKALDLVYSVSTTNTTAPAGFTIGCIWSLGA